MGNCLVRHNKVIRVMKADGEVIQYKEPMKVHQVLSEFAGHAITDKLPGLCHLEGNTDLIGGQLYYLLPLPESPMEFEEKSLGYVWQPQFHDLDLELEEQNEFRGTNLTLSIPIQWIGIELPNIPLEYSKPKAEVSKGSSGIVRIKLVITKQELEEILRKGGISMADIVSRLQKNGGSEKFYDEDHRNCEGWKPILESIPEVN